MPTPEPPQRANPYLVIFGNGTYAKAVDITTVKGEKSGMSFKKIKMYMSPELYVYENNIYPSQDDAVNFDSVFFGNGTYARVLEVSDPYYHEERREVVRDVKIWLTDELIYFEKMIIRTPEGRIRKFYDIDLIGQNHILRTYPARYFVEGNDHPITTSSFILCGFNNQDTVLLEKFRAELDRIGKLEAEIEDYKKATTAHLIEGDKLRRNIKEYVKDIKMTEKDLRRDIEISEEQD